MQLQPGTLLQGGRYRIISTLGNGGFGITYLAEQSMTERKVCIKEFFPKGYYTRQGDSNDVRISSPEFENNMVRYKAKFVKEAKTIARLDHPNIVHIFDAFEENDTAYYVMEYIEGESLSSIVKRLGALSEAVAFKYIHQVADALRYIHEQRIMHLDVKPGNIMVRQQDDRNILIDFGLSKHYDESSGEATSTTPVGVSHGYAPMEQYRTGGVKSFSPETDIYSLGATLYYLVTGTTPPEAAEIADEGLPTLPSHLSSGVRNTIERSMESQRKSRPHSIGEFLALLDDCDKSSEVELTISPTLESGNTLILDSQTSLGDKTIIGNESLLPPTNEIWYTSSDGKFVKPFKTEVFGAKIVSHTYNNGKGVIKFSGDVTKIGELAFYECSNLTSVNIPNSVTTIDGSAFSRCSNLTSVNIPNSVTTIRSGAFQGCSSLTSVNIPSSVTTIGVCAFEGCSSLTSVNIPNSVTTIGECAFVCCSSLTSVNIPSSVTTIWYSAFRGCSSLKEFKGKFASADGRCLIIDNKLIAFAPAGLKEYIIPNSVTTIEQSAFSGCSSLTSVNIPNSVTTIARDAFANCSSLTSVTIPDNVTTIGMSAFFGCSSLTSATIPDNVTTIGVCAFSDCSSLTSITIPNSVTTIGWSAFSGCSILTSVNIPNSVTKIENNAFKGCISLKEFKGKFTSADGRCLIIDNKLIAFAPAGLKEYFIPSSVTTIERSVFAGCSSLRSVNIPNSVTTIASDAFAGCSSLTSVNIPDNVTTIGWGAFQGCSNLTSINIPSSVTKIGDWAFEGCDKLPWETEREIRMINNRSC